jgi:hypothetical protein
MMNMESERPMMGENEPPDGEYAVEAVKNLKDLLARGLADELFRRICPSAANTVTPQPGEQELDGVAGGKEQDDSRPFGKLPPGRG